MTISIPPVTRQQTSEETPPGWERRIGPRLFAGVNKTSPNVKTKIIRKLTALQDLWICIDLSSGPKKRIWNMSDYPLSIEIRRFALIFWELAIVALELQTCEELSHAAKSRKPDIQANGYSAEAHGSITF